MRLGLCLGSLLLVWTTALVAVAEETRIGRQVDSFSLPDYRGKLHSLDDFAERRAVVVVFLGTDCPLVKLYGRRLAELAKEFDSQGVQFVGINSNLQDTITEIAGYAHQAGIEFPILKDSGNAIADQLGATRTPEVFVLDAKRAIRYQGRIDDQHGSGSTNGYAKSDVTQRDLANALDQLLAGKEVTTPVTSTVGCLIGRVARVEPHGEITYTKHIASILQDHCVTCHRPGEVGPFALNSYEEVVGWADMIREVVSQERMPPWFANPEFGKFSNDCRLSAEERQALDQWIECGCPEGDLADLPPAKQFPDGWKMGEPDQIIYMSDEPYQVATTGLIDYQYYFVDPGFKEDMWVSAMECRPGNRAVVHHIGVTIHKNVTSVDIGSGVIIGWVPGMPPTQFPPGVAMKIPAGSVFKFQMHYTANGNPELDRSCVAFKFVDPKSVKQEAAGIVCGNLDFHIPPEDPNFKLTSTLGVGRDTLVLTMLPHMHLRGKAFRFEVKYPDGTQEVLLDVPRYDFNWQLWYDLAEPKLLPKGTKITCTAWWDNSAENPFNPDPTAKVRYGEQSWEEMMLGFMTTIDPHQNLQTDPPKVEKPKRRSKKTE